MKTRYQERLDEMKLNRNTESNTLTDKHFTASSNNSTMEPTKNNVPVEADVNEKSQRMTTPPVPGNKYKVICDYTSNDDDEISVKKGDVVTVVNVDGKWLLVSNGNIEGLIPVNVIDYSSHSDVCKTKHLLTQTPIKSKDGVGSASISKLLNKVFSLNFFIIVIPLFSFLIGIFYLRPYFNYSGSTVKSTYTLDERITYLEKKFSRVYNDSLNNLSGTLYSCLSSTLKGDKPCIILLLSDGDKMYSDLHREIGLLSAAVFLKHENDIITIKSSALTDISCTFFEKYKKLLDENKVMLVLDLEKVPMEVIKQFHSLCDEYNPAVKQSVIVFMLNYQDIEADFGKNDASYANNLLHKLWEKHIDKDLLEALVIRVSGNVVRLGGRRR